MSANKENTLDIVSVGRAFATTADGVSHSIDTLNRQSLLKAAKIAFPDTPGNLWFRVNSDAARDAIRTGSVPDFDAAGSDKSASDKSVRFLHSLQRAAGEPLTYPATQAECSQAIDRLKAAAPAAVDPPSAPQAPVAAPAAAVASPVTGEGADLIRQGLEALAAGLIPAGPAPVDEEAVRAIVDAAVSTAVEAARIQPREITVKGPRTTSTINGRTHKVFARVLALVGRGYHVLLVGPAGSGKSTIAALLQRLQESSSVLLEHSHD